VNQAVLKDLDPEHVEVEIWRADELAQRHGLASELDEMWSYGGKKGEAAVVVARDRSSQWDRIGLRL